jgi:hypothetical protein
VRAEVSLDSLKPLKNRPLCEELGVILRALTVVAATRILRWEMTDGVPTPAAGCCGIGVDGRCQVVVAAVAHVAKAVEMSVLRLDQAKPRVPKRVGPVQGLEQGRVDLTRAVGSDSRPLTKTLDKRPAGRHTPANCSGSVTVKEQTSKRRERQLDRRADLPQPLPRVARDPILVRPSPHEITYTHGPVTARLAAHTPLVLSA